MNVKRIAALSLVALAVGFSSAKADPWGRGHEWVRPRVAVEFRIPAPRIFVPPVPVMVEGSYYGRRPHRVVQYRSNGCNQPVPNCNNSYNSYNGYNNNQYNGNGNSNGCNNGYNNNQYNGNGYNRGNCR